MWIGAIATAALFTLGKFLIGYYIGKTGIASAYGAAGSLAVLLVWVYYSAQIFLLGAEFTWAYAYSMGSRAGKSLPQPTVQRASEPVSARPPRRSRRPPPMARPRSSASARRA